MPVRAASLTWPRRLLGQVDTRTHRRVADALVEAAVAELEDMIIATAAWAFEVKLVTLDLHSTMCSGLPGLSTPVG